MQLVVTMEIRNLLSHPRPREMFARELMPAIKAW